MKLATQFVAGTSNMQTRYSRFPSFPEARELLDMHNTFLLATHIL
jgi:hypothetical protein